MASDAIQRPQIKRLELSRFGPQLEQDHSLPGGEVGPFEVQGSGAGLSDLLHLDPRPPVMTVLVICNPQEVFAAIRRDGEGDLDRQLAAHRLCRWST